ncbi:MAG: glutamate-5-semialdehyde dehydrogenase [Polyangiales bacterium]
MSDATKTPATTPLRDALRRAREAQRALGLSSTHQRDEALDAIARRLEMARPAVLRANAQDLARATSLSPAMRDRLALTDARYDALVSAVRELRSLADPLGEERLVAERPNGLKVYRRRIALGLIAVIYEARPNVTVEAACIALRAGNAIALRGGSEALATNVALVEAVRAGVADAELPPEVVLFIEDTARERVAELLGASGLVDLAIPRGGPSLMEFVDAHARVPVIRHGAGVCHVYVDHAADLSMASHIAFNAKVHRPGVCNAMETLLVHVDAAQSLLPTLGRRYVEAGVTIRADARAKEFLAAAGVPCEAATEADWDTEYLSLTVALRCVDSLEDALAHVAKHGTGHTAAIVTSDREAAERFLAEVDASCVLWNASTRFNDGGELGLGAEIGISTSKMHAFGPMSLRELTAEKFVVRGDGQVRR